MTMVFLFHVEIIHCIYLQGSTPQYSYTSDNCEYYFIWLTNLACDINEQEDVTDDCTAVNPATGETHVTQTSPMSGQALQRLAPVSDRGARVAPNQIEKKRLWVDPNKFGFQAGVHNITLTLARLGS